MASIATLEKIAATGGISANQILGAVYALPMLRRKVEMVNRRIEITTAGRTPMNTDTEYARIIAAQVGELASTMAYNHPDAGRYATEYAMFCFTRTGLPGLIKVIEMYIGRAENTAALVD